jgi:hypothetical protein
LGDRWTGIGQRFRGGRFDRKLSSTFLAFAAAIVRVAFLYMSPIAVISWILSSALSWTMHRESIQRYCIPSSFVTIITSRMVFGRSVEGIPKVIDSIFF